MWLNVICSIPFVFGEDLAISQPIIFIVFKSILTISSECDRCSDNYYPNGNGCSLCTEQHCTTCDSSSGKCFTCEEGYYLYQQEFQINVRSEIQNQSCMHGRI